MFYFKLNVIFGVSYLFQVLIAIVIKPCYFFCFVLWNKLAVIGFDFLRWDLWGCWFKFFFAFFYQCVFFFFFLLLNFLATKKLKILQLLVKDLCFLKVHVMHIIVLLMFIPNFLWLSDFDFVMFLYSFLIFFICSLFSFLCAIIFFCWVLQC